jgi:hypothetical protein
MYICAQTCISYLTNVTVRYHQKGQAVNVASETNSCILWLPYKTHKYTVWIKCRVLWLNLVVPVLTTRF